MPPLRLFSGLALLGEGKKEVLVYRLLPRHS
jgi:hypothetical protein